LLTVCIDSRVSGLVDDRNVIRELLFRVQRSLENLQGQKVDGSATFATKAEWLKLALKISPEPRVKM